MVPGYESLRAEVAQASRRLRRDPGYALTVVLVLGIGLGFAIAFSAAVYRLMVAPLPYAAPGRLVVVTEAREDRRPLGVSLANLEDLRQAPGLEGLAGYRRRSFGIGLEETASVVSVGMATGDLFSVLRAPFALGRAFDPFESRDGERVIVLGDRLWRGAFGADPTILGRTVTLNEVGHTVVGVLDPDFDFGGGGAPFAAFVPLRHQDYGHARGLRSLEAIGRLEMGVSRTAAQAALSVVADGLAAAYPDAQRGHTALVLDPRHACMDGNRRPVLLLSVAASMLLLIAVTSAANLLVARIVARLPSVALRAALGARRLGASRGFVVEAVLLSCAGAALGLAVADGLLRALPSIVPAFGGHGNGALASLRLDVAAVLGAALLLVTTASILSTLPAWLTRQIDLGSLLKASSPPQALRARLRASLVVGQVAFSTMLLLGTTVLGASFYHLARIDPGFRVEERVSFGLGLPEARYDEPGLIRFHQQLLAAIAARPGVRAIGAAASLPLAGRGFRTRFALGRSGDELDEEPGLGRVAINVVSPGYFQTLEIPLRAGRDFERGDTIDGERVMLINEAFASTYLSRSAPGMGAVTVTTASSRDDPGAGLGTWVRLSWFSGVHPRGASWQVIGVVSDTREVALDASATPMVYLSLGQFPVEGASYAIHAAPGALDREAVQAEIDRLDPALQRVTVAPLSRLLARSLADRRLTLVLCLALAGTALLLTAIGLHGLMAFRMGERRLEMALRRALGARAGHVLRLVTGDGLRLTAAGAGVGGVGFLVLRSGIGHVAFGVTATDPRVVLAVVGILVATTLLACAWPAWRVLRAQPNDVIRQGQP